MRSQGRVNPFGGVLARLVSGAVDTWRSPKLRPAPAVGRIRGQDRRFAAGTVFSSKVDRPARKNFRIRRVHLTLGLAKWVASAGHGTINLLKNKAFIEYKNRSFSPVKASRTPFAPPLRKISRQDRVCRKKLQGRGIPPNAAPHPPRLPPCPRLRANSEIGFVAVDFFLRYGVGGTAITGLPYISSNTMSGMGQNRRAAAPF